MPSVPRRSCSAPSDPVEHPAAVELACGNVRLKVGTEIDKVPAQPVDLPCPLSYEVRAMVDEQPDLHCPLVQERSRETLHSLPQHSTSDRASVDLIRLPRLALPTTGLTHHLRGNPHHTLTSSDQRLLQAPGEVPAVLDRPHPFLAELPGPAQTSPVPNLISPDLDLPSQHASGAVDCGQRMRALVDIRSDHDHYLRPFVGCHQWTNLRWTNLSRGEATLLSSHAGDPRAAASDTTDVGQTIWSTARL
jgi:hypothetical protein